jgi:NTE family protein
MLRTQVLTATLLLLTLGGLVPSPSSAQTTGEGTQRPRIGLALSGGSAKGLAHIGLILVLEELGVPIDLIAGTSMGALVGGLFASGYDGEELEEIATSLPWSHLFTDKVERELLGAGQRAMEAGVAFSFPIRNNRIALPSGLIRGENIQRLLEEITWQTSSIEDFDKLPTPFTAVATDLETREAVVIRSGQLADALRVSMSLPGIFSPHTVDGRPLVDGGLVRNLPAQDARAMGADFLICSDVSGPPEPLDETDNLKAVLNQSVALLLDLGTDRQRGLCDLLIRHDVRGLDSGDFDQAQKWIARGREGARRHEAALRTVAIPGIGPEVYRQAVPTLPDSVFVSRVEIEGIASPEAERIVRRTLALPSPAYLGPLAVDEAIGRIYATELFSKAGYRVEATPTDTAIIVGLAEQPRDNIGFGFRYTDDRKASLLFSAKVHNPISYGSVLRIGIRLGEQMMIEGRYLHGLGVGSSFGTALDGGYASGLFRFFEDGAPRVEVRTRMFFVGGAMGTTIGPANFVGVRLGFQRARTGTTVAAEEAKQNVPFQSLRGIFYRNTLDRRIYPTRGMEMRIHSEWATDWFKDGSGFQLNLVKIDGNIPLPSKTVLELGGVVGAASGPGLPVHRFFFAGGAYPSAVFGETQPAFWGLTLQQRWGKAVQVFRLSLRKEFSGGIHARAGINAGNVFPDWEFTPEDYSVGWMFSLGKPTAIGPVEATVHGLSLDDWPILNLNIGHSF